MSSEIRSSDCFPLKCLRNNEFKLRYNNDKIEIGTLPHFGITKEFV